MPDTPHCAKCGAALAAYALDGFCSACLLERGLLGETPKAIPPQRHDQRIGRYELIDEIARGGMGVRPQGLGHRTGPDGRAQDDSGRTRRPACRRLVALALVQGMAAAR